MVVFGQIDCFRAKVTVLEQKWLYSEQSDCTRVKWLYSGKVAVFGQSGFIRAKVVLFGQKWLYSGSSGCF